jgi:hypothetical protein
LLSRSAGGSASGVILAVERLAITMGWLMDREPAIAR